MGSIPPWFKPRRYRHFDRPVTTSAVKDLLRYTEDSKRVARHSFFPFVSFQINTPRYNRSTKKVEIKSRPISYASHRDSFIYSRYANFFSALYESFLHSEGIASCVIAYRKIDGKSNIDFACEVFDSIVNRGECAVVCCDVKSFFDTIDHCRLLDRLRDLFGTSSLAEDVFRVVKSICRYSHVDKDVLEKLFPNSAGSNRSNPYCTAKEFRTLVRKGNFVKTNTSGIGIPQGSPASGILSNIYMMQFDVHIANMCKDRSWIYRRYSDDILIICDVGMEEHVVTEITNTLSAVGLQIQEKKTEIRVFSRSFEGTYSKRPVQYLGFTFDGVRRLIRGSSLSRYWGKMGRARIAKLSAAKKNKRNFKCPAASISKLYEVYSHLGKRNFYSYARRAEEKMGDPGIKRQLRKHWKKVNGSP